MPTLAPRPCTICARGYEPTSEAHLYCSAECKLLGRYQPCRICGNPTTTTRAKATPATKHGACWEHGTRAGYDKHGCRCDSCSAAAVRGRTLNPLRTVKCPTCRTSFQTRRKSAVHCSTVCSQGGKWKGSGWIDPALRQAIYERDNWTCQLCMEPVDVDAHYNDARYPSLDHINPRALADLPDHTPTNLRTAHRRCNTVRGIRADPLMAIAA